MKLVALGVISFDHPDGKGAKVRVSDLDDPKGKGEIFLGLSKRNPKDTPDDAIGHALALGRALVEAGSELIARAEETSFALDLVKEDPELVNLLMRNAQPEPSRTKVVGTGDWVIVGSSADRSFHLVSKVAALGDLILACRPRHTYSPLELFPEAPNVRRLRCPECTLHETYRQMARNPQLPLV